MKKLTDKAENELKLELETFRKYILKNSLFYADIDDSVVINESHIKKAAEEYNSNYNIANRDLFEKRSKDIVFKTLIISLLSIFFAVISLYSTMFYIDSLPVIMTSLVVFILVLVSLIIILSHYREQKMGEKERKVLKFLNKWNNMEFILRNLYEKEYQKEPGSIKELLFFYIDKLEGQNQRQDSLIFSLLQSRNDIIHKNVKKVSINTLDESINDMDEILFRLKKIESIINKINQE